MKVPFQCRPVQLVSLFLFLLTAASLFAQDANVERTGDSPVETKFSSGGHVRMDLCPAAVQIVGSEKNELRVDYDSKNNSADVRVRIHVAGEHADLRVTRCPHNNFQMTIEIPKSSDLYVRMFAGEMGVKGISGNKDVELHAGHLTMEIGEPAEYAHVEASVLTGDLEAPSFDIAKGGILRSFERSGPGKYRVYAHVGAGQLELR
jgi:hypothetical protein